MKNEAKKQLPQDAGIVVDRKTDRGLYTALEFVAAAVSTDETRYLMWGPPMRLGNTSEITLITMSRRDPGA